MEETVMTSFAGVGSGFFDSGLVCSPAQLWRASRLVSLSARSIFQERESERPVSVHERELRLRVPAPIGGEDGVLGQVGHPPAPDEGGHEAT